MEKKGEAMDFEKSKASYVTPEFEVVGFVAVDIITTSDVGGVGNGNIDDGAWDKG